jgi:hypothetical protein
VTRERTLPACGKAASRARFLALLLLAFIGWGATAEFTHCHSTRVNQASLQTPSEVAFVSDFGRTTTSKSKSPADCLICQLHQNLSNTVVTAAPVIGALSQSSFNPIASQALHYGDFSSSQRGRAPPQIL